MNDFFLYELAKIHQQEILHQACVDRRVPKGEPPLRRLARELRRVGGALLSIAV